MSRPQRPGAPLPGAGQGSSKQERRAALKAERERRAARARQQRRVRQIGLVVAAALVVAAIALAVYFFVIAPASTAIEGLRTLPDEGRTHVAQGEQVNYANNPPASGPHYNVTANYGFYDRPVEEELWVHNLEHGGVVILYRPGQPNDAELKAQLRDAFNTFPRSNACPTPVTKLVIAPYENLQSPIMLIAWNHQLALDAWDRQKAQAFYERFVDKGPERAC